MQPISDCVVSVGLAGARADMAAASSSWTPLHYAAQDGFVNVVKCLLDHGGADADATTSDGYTPLHVAADNGHVDTVQACERQPAD